MYHNLDVTISVGYRVNSKQATQFRKWSTNTLTEYITKGFIINVQSNITFYRLIRNMKCKRGLTPSFFME
jgi:hypothetical protein